MTSVLEPPALEDLESSEHRALRRAEARNYLGFDTPGVAGFEAPPTGTPVATEPLGVALKAAGVTRYPVTALGLLAIADQFQGNAFTVLTPNISLALGISTGAMGLARVVGFIAQVIAPLPMAALAQRPGRRAMLCVVTGISWSILTCFTGFSLSLAALIFILLFDGLSTGSVSALHVPLVADVYPPGVRLRTQSLYAAFATSASVFSPLLVGLLAGPLNLTWRGVFFAMGGISLVSALFSLGLRDVRPGARDTALVHEHAEDDAPFGAAVDVHLAATETDLKFFEIVRRLLLVPTIQRLCGGFLVFGMLTIPLLTFLSEFLYQRWGLGDAERGYFFAAVAAVAVLGLLVFGKLGEGFLRSSPEKVLNFGGLALIGGVIAIAIGALIPNFAGMCLFFAIGQTTVGLLTPGLYAVLTAIVDSPQRPHAVAMMGLFIAFGAIFGVIFLSSVGVRYGNGGSMAALAIPGVIAGLIIRSAGKLVDKDLDRMVTTILETEDIAAITASGGRLPMLTSRSVNFSYGQLQVLFDVDFTVDEGEMVALLGTNGAGKSTLLKVISGIGLPQSGTVRYRGQDITYLDAERRVSLGITQIPGGRAVFGPCDVMENLRAYGYASKAPKREVDEAIDRCLTVFPRLAERRTSLAATLSGGEQQMLALSKALILKPRLLLIDELSLGLAPIIVGQLLDMVRQINAEGTAVVLVEQSVNIALSLVNHAYFMEKGEMRFDGPAKDLLGRDDLLRAVFLEGATKGTQTASKASKTTGGIR